MNNNSSQLKLSGIETLSNTEMQNLKGGCSGSFSWETFSWNDFWGSHSCHHNYADSSSSCSSTTPTPTPTPSTPPPILHGATG